MARMVQWAGTMPTYNLQANMETGELSVVDREGNCHSIEELEDAEDRAARGDPAAQALLRAVDLSIVDGREVSEDELDATVARATRACPAFQEAAAIALPIHVSEIDRTRDPPRWPRRDMTEAGCPA